MSEVSADTPAPEGLPAEGRFSAVIAEPGEELSADEALDVFMDVLLDAEIEPYDHQEEAFLELAAGHHLILATPTGSGKSLVATCAHALALAAGERSVYTSPIKALVSEKFFALCRDFGADQVGMLTGDAAINKDAPILCCTAEVLAQMALGQGAELDQQTVIMDEFHYYADRDRGMAWQIPLLLLSEARFVLLSATLGDTYAIERDIEARTGVEVVVVKGAERPVPLEFEYRDDPLQSVIEELIGVGRGPIYLVQFSQREATSQAGNLMSINVLDKSAKQRISSAIGGFRFDSPFGKTLSRLVRHGIGLHHAGLLPRYRLLVERLAAEGLLALISGTDTLGVGINVPIRTVMFDKLCKFDGVEVRHLKVREFQQIAGRAGRKGFDDVGYVVGLEPAHVIENRRLAAKNARLGKKKWTKKKPPERGYKHWTEQTFGNLQSGSPEALTPVFRVDIGMIVALLRRPEPGRHGAYGAVVDLIARSHGSARDKRDLRRRAAGLFRSLRHAGIIEVLPAEVDADGEVMMAPEVVLHDDLQANFQLHRAVSLFLVEALGELPESATDEEHALNVLSLIEATLENPRPILFAQVRREKGRLIGALKAEGVPYEERMEKLETVTYPKPNADWIYAQFNTWAARHPWVDAELIRPKGVACEMIAEWLPFNDYVRDLGLETIEGQLLRYLSQVYRTLVQSVPDAHKTDAVVELQGWLRAMLARVDSSLVQAWEKLKDGDDEGPALPVHRPPADPSRDKRAFMARVRAELHTVVRALSRQQWQEAADYLREGTSWNASRLEAVITAFNEELGSLRFDGYARLADKTTLIDDGPRRWRVAQTLCDAEGEETWALRGVVDLSDWDAEADGPLVTLVDVGV
ncbi:MAG: DUF3516 domain-containing protein [Myxococcales bacterium]|nr:DUF3516 domain-containing protein [Myxococcales bacterium]